jgi:rare lipoprotein A
MIMTHLTKRLFFVFALAFFLYGCAGGPEIKSQPGKPKPYKVLGKWYEPLADSKGFKERGLASWYGRDFHGKKTSNGETYDMYAMTAAHKTLPLGTWVNVKNLDNYKEIEVKINDRGPFVRGRIIDLSYTAAQRLGAVGPGTVPVEVIALGTPAPSAKGSRGPRTYIPGDYYTGNFTIQIGAFTVRENAENMKKQMEKTHDNVHIVIYEQDGQVFYRVRVSRTNSLDEAMKFEAALEARGFRDAFVVAE